MLSLAHASQGIIHVKSTYVDIRPIDYRKLLKMPSIDGRILLAMLTL